MRTSVVTVVLLALTAGGAGWSAAGDEKAAKRQEAMKALVQAECDFARRQQELGLVGSAPLVGLAAEASAPGAESLERPTSEEGAAAVTAPAPASAPEASGAPGH